MKKLQSTDAGHIYELKQKMSKAEQRRQAQHCEDQAYALNLHPRDIFSASAKKFEMMAEVLREDDLGETS
jgi:hypothetical protein